MPAVGASCRPAARGADGEGDRAAAASGRAAERRGARLSPSARPSHRLRRAALYPLLRLYHGAVPAAARRSSRLADIPRDADPVAGAASRVPWRRAAWRAVRGDAARGVDRGVAAGSAVRSEEHTSELQSLMRISYAVFCLQKKKTT